ncbi:MRPS28 37S ribosomal protein S28 [Candida maltosa Xu316]|uniref:Uncharacterized protein n=1 Tax=Candida maltosa (strain Xu316) TaxID=1245528 RepID=M3IR44_CANMX|nr:hypothetical protein G210_0346 [Candida maltosa Xu316]
MFKFSTRLFTTGRLLFNQEAVSAAVPRFKVTLAARRMGPVSADKKRAKRLRKKENRIKRRIIKEVNILKQYDINNVALTVDPVLGSSDCKFVERIMEKVENQEFTLAHGVSRVEFEKLLYAAEKVALENASNNEELRKNVIETEENKRRALLTILNTRNTNVADKKKMAVKFAKEEMQRSPGDTASPEVQAAIATVKIHFAMQQVKNMPKDKKNIQHVRQMVQHRQKILKYLKRTDAKQYYYAIAKLGLSDDAVEREFNMGKQYMQDFKVWGDKVLVKETASVAKKNKKVKDLRDRVAEYNALAKRNFEILNGKTVS